MDIIQYMYMTTTINISLPKTMYQDAKRLLARRGYTSISELIRDSLRNELYPKVTVNGFTPEFEEEVLKSAAEPRKNDIQLRSDGDVENYFLHLKFPRKKSIND